MQFILWMAELAWNLLLIGLGFKLFWWILHDGKHQIPKWLGLAAKGIKAGCKLLQIKLEEKTKEKELENSDESDVPVLEPVEKGEPVNNKVEYRII